MESASKKSKRPLVFLAVGGGNTLLDFICYTLLTSVIFKNGSHIALAGFISGSIALFFAFLTHSFITWRGTNVSHKTLLKFIAFTGFGMWVIRPLLLSQFIKFSGLYHWAHDLTDTIGIDFSYNFIANTGAFGFMIVIVLAYNYSVYERFVFNPKSSRTEPESH